MKRFYHAILSGAAFLTCLSSPLLGAGKITTVAQVANNENGVSHVFILVDGVEGAKLAPRYTLFHKPGVANAAGNYAKIGTILATENVNTVSAHLALAEDAGFNNAELESTLDGMLGDPTGSLAEKLLNTVNEHLPNGMGELRKRMLVRSFPQTALPLGQGFIAVVPSGTNTFEVRNEAGDQVVGRATTTGDPAVLPAVGRLGERIDATATGDLTVSLRWCTPNALKLRSMHVAGYHIYRVSVERWQDQVGGSVPLNMDRDLLLTSLAHGVIDQVNRALVAPEEDLDCPLDLTSETFFFIDANDTKDQPRNAEGGEAFEDGEEVVYFAAGVSHVGVVGMPSPGLPVTVCDRLPPNPPADLRVDNKHDYDAATETGYDFLEVSWVAQPDDEVEYYCVHRYREDANGALKDRASGNWPANNNLVAIVANVPNVFGRVVFRDDGTNEVPGALPHPTIPANANETYWYTVCAIDRSACKDDQGYGNVGAPTGAVPAALYRSDGPGEADGRLRIPCCELVVTNEPDGVNGTPEPRLTLTGFRNSRRINRVDFAVERMSDNEIIPLASRIFPKNPQIKQVSAEVNLEDFTDFRLLARFRTNVGKVSDWNASQVFSVPNGVPDFQFFGQWDCSKKSPGGCGGIVDPVDPDTGEFVDICLNLNAPPARAVELAIYTRIANGPMIRRYRDAYEAGMQVCFPAPATPGEVCVFTQTFDDDGNPGIVSPFGCVETIGHEGYPVPIITNTESWDAQIGDHTGLNTLGWSSPTSGVHRFEYKVSPPLPNADRILDESEEAGVIKRSWSFHDTLSLPGGFGSGGSDFAQVLPLIIGETHVLCVRAVGSGDPDTRATGDWSDPEELYWSPETGGGNPPQDGVSFPIRPVPGDSPIELLSVYSPNEADIVVNDRYLWVEVGELDRELVERETIITAGISVPAILNVESLEPYLFFDLPMVGYMQRVDVPDKPTLQTTHFIDEILTDDSIPGQITLIDESFFVARKKSKSKVSIWLRMAMPPAKGGSYRCTILQHHPDRETRAVYRTNNVQL